MVRIFEDCPKTVEVRLALLLGYLRRMGRDVSRNR